MVLWRIRDYSFIYKKTIVIKNIRFSRSTYCAFSLLCYPDHLQLSSFSRVQYLTAQTISRPSLYLRQLPLSLYNPLQTIFGVHLPIQIRHSCCLFLPPLPPLLAVSTSLCLPLLVCLLPAQFSYLCFSSFYLLSYFLPRLLLLFISLLSYHFFT